MDFALDEDQQELAATVRSLLAKRADSAAVRAATRTASGFDTELWSALAEQVGVAALAVPEEYDGVGASFFETAVVLEELGRTVAPSPLLATTVATQVLLAAGTDEAKERLLPRLAAGEVGTVVVDADRPALDVDHAAVVLAVQGPDLVEVHEPSTLWAESMDQTLRLAHVELTGARTTVVGDGPAAADRARLVLAAGGAALAVGLCQRALDETVAYAKEREQFGRPIGSFQALKHRMADMLVRTELARSASWAASYALGRDDDTEAARLAHVAAASAVEAARLVSAEAIQLHGGIAITWEHDAHLWFKRAHALGEIAGAPHRHRAALLA